MISSSISPKKSMVALFFGLGSLAIPAGLWLYFSNMSQARAVNGTIEAIPPATQSVDWLHSGSSGDLQVALEQLNLFLHNESPLGGELGIRQKLIHAEAGRITRTAEELRQNPVADDCYSNSQRACLLSILGNAQSEYMAATTAQEKLLALSRLEAVVLALTQVPTHVLPDEMDATVWALTQRVGSEIRASASHSLESNQRRRILQEGGIE